MNTETILTRVNAVMAYCDNAPMAGAMLKDLAADLSADIRAQCAKRQGVGNAAKTLTAILNAQKKRDTRTALHYAWLDDAGRQCVCDGFQAYRLREPLPLFWTGAGVEFITDATALAFDLSLIHI